MEVAEQGNFMATWAFACRYPFKDVLATLEQIVRAEDLHRALKKGQLYTDDMPAVSIVLGAESLTRMLQRISKDLLELACLGIDKLGSFMRMPTATGNVCEAHYIKRRVEPVYAQACSLLLQPDAPPG
jgi:hypothetical protein